MDTIVPDDVTRRILARYEAAEMITLCAWCLRGRLDDEWPLVPREALAAIDHVNSLTHGICPVCSSRLSPS